MGLTDPLMPMPMVYQTYYVVPLERQAPMVLQGRLEGRQSWCGWFGGGWRNHNGCVSQRCR